MADEFLHGIAKDIEDTGVGVLDFPVLQDKDTDERFFCELPEFFFLGAEFFHGFLVSVCLFF